jgi:haloacid dehalogenase-like hydrolase
VFNKGAVMVLSAGVNKASGLVTALARLKLSPLNVVGIGDGENDHAFLRACGCAVAVANALPMVKADADIVTSEPRGAEWPPRCAASSTATSPETRRGSSDKRSRSHAIKKANRSGCIRNAAGC